MNHANKFLLSVFFVLAMSAVMLFTENKSGGESGIIVKLEFAPTIEEVKQLVANYDDEHIQWLKLNTEFDFIFILTYSSLFFFALKCLMERFKKVNQSRLLLSIVFIPGVLDVIENIFILGFLNRNFSTPYFNIYYWCVHIKWGLVAVFVLIAIFQLVLTIRHKVTAK